VRPGAQATVSVEQFPPVVRNQVGERFEVEVGVAGKEGRHLAVGLFGGVGTDRVDQPSARFYQWCGLVKNHCLAFGEHGDVRRL